VCTSFTEFACSTTKNRARSFPAHLVYPLPNLRAPPRRIVHGVSVRTSFTLYRICVFHHEESCTLLYNV